MTRTEILDRYRHLRTISKHHHSAALELVSRSTLLEIAKQLGLTLGRVLVAERAEEMTLVFDLSTPLKKGAHVLWIAMLAPRHPHLARSRR